MRVLAAVAALAAVANANTVWPKPQSQVIVSPAAPPHALSLHVVLFFVPSLLCMQWCSPSGLHSQVLHDVPN
jgi:hypothetical protein